jgi:hypothetical protein
MMNTALASVPPLSSITDVEAMPWVPIAPGFSFKLIEYLDERGAVIKRSAAMTATEAYRRGCTS